MKIYHNPRCAKSRQTLALLQDHGVEPEVILYLSAIPSHDELQSLLTKLGISPLQLIRKGEAIWKENFKGKELSDDELIKAMIAHPKLIERPIVVKGQKAVLGRPPENALELL
ncbi:arsenate reductase (glutaredoxin) [Flavobacteriales bacterium]|jgi:arsenate reductase|nr:arsenate reductase (glutaredoxin) [Flavobacteriales bacterium]MDB2622017.1 arsenate reductase (glutaredoxin) [Flavobacteriales bacterium]